eukprot:15327200-Ditylum_brightwellii.AAC.1
MVVGRNDGFVDDDGCSKTDGDNDVDGNDDRFAVIKTDGDHDSHPMLCVAETPKTPPEATSVPSYVME